MRAHIAIALALLVGIGTLWPRPVHADFNTPPTWFDQNWHYRIPINTTAAALVNTTATIDIDFAAALTSMNVAGTLDVRSVRVVRPNGTLAARQQFTDRKFGNATDAAGNDRGEVRFIVQDAGPAQYYVYFDITANGTKAAWPRGSTINGNFEFGGANWTTGSNVGSANQNNEVHPTGGEGATVNLAAACSDGGATVANTPFTADGYHLIGYRDNCEDGAGNELVWVQRTITLPNTPNPGNLTVQFRLQGHDSYAGGTQYDWFRIQAGVGGNPPNVNHNNLAIPNADSALFINAAGVGRALAFSTAYTDMGWRQATLNLNQFPQGSTITVQFEMRYFTDQIYRTWTGIDDVAWSLVNVTAGVAESYGANITDPVDTAGGPAVTSYHVGDVLSVRADAQTLLAATRVVADVLDNAGNQVASDIQLFDDGTHGDATAGDGTWTNDGTGATPTYTFTTSDPIGPNWTVRLRARDGAGIARIPGSPATPVDETNFYNVDTQVFELRLSVSGRVYQDAQPNFQAEAGEDWTGAPPVVVNLVQGGAVVQFDVVPPGTGAFEFKNITAGSYELVLTDTITNTVAVEPSNRLFAEPRDGRRAITLATRALADQNLGVWHGARVEGEVFRDDGAGAATGNDGVRGASEGGLGGVSVIASDGGATTWAQTSTEADGSYELWIPASANASTVFITETNPSAHVSVSGSAGTTAGSYDLATDRTSYTNASGTAYTGVDFGDVPAPTFQANGLQSSLPGIVVFYPHTFIAGTEGSVAFTLAQTSTPAAPPWAANVLHDQDCDGVLDPTEPELLAPVATQAGDSVCVIVRNTIPEGAALESQDLLEVTATFTYANAVGVAPAALMLTDLTTVSGTATAGLVLHKTVDKPSANPGEVLTYTIEYTNTGSGPISDVEVFDATPAFTTFVSATCGTTPPGLTCAITAQPAPTATGDIHWTINGGTLAPSAVGTVTFSVRID